MRIGHGFDVHAFADGPPLILGGVEVPHPRGLAGHSDGDVALHAIADALLGAAALGDIGGMFPSSDARWSGANSRDLLRLVGERLRTAAHTIVNVDVTMVAEAPRLADYTAAMRAVVAAALSIEVSAVSVKATSTDSLGFTGRGEGIAAFAVALIE